MSYLFNNSKFDGDIIKSYEERKIKYPNNCINFINEN